MRKFFFKAHFRYIFHLLVICEQCGKELFRRNLQRHLNRAHNYRDLVKCDLCRWRLFLITVDVISSDPPLELSLGWFTMLPFELYLGNTLWFFNL